MPPTTTTTTTSTATVTIKEGKQTARQAAKKFRQQNPMVHTRPSPPPKPKSKPHNGTLHDVALRGFREAREARDSQNVKAVTVMVKDKEGEDEMEEISLRTAEEEEEEAALKRKSRGEEEKEEEKGWDMCTPLREEVDVLEGEDGWQVLVEVRE